ncbi:MAG: UDP-N-acetylmuramoyl-L-alanyl-D-glutamate--2,6-diaminopimelate ligase [Planctomycetota bacterium]|nr:UDP-N-acetylmuramoyl-L-alanyl-D-glutamate--2,6-diaminopimelate ligase [Planctomycetota bacterium]
MQIAHRAQGVSLRKLLPDSRFLGDRDIRIHSCSGNPRGVRPGDLFVALQTGDFDGHDQVGEALQRGAAAVLAERMLSIDAPLCVVPDSREAFGQICQELAGQPARRLRTVGVTGTNGKTTTSLLIASVLRAGSQATGVLTGMFYDDTEDQVTATRTTPQAPELADWLSRMAAHDCRNAVLEVSSRALAEKRTAGVAFDVAVVTNVRREHLDYHGSLQNYRRMKTRLLQQLKPQGFAVINADDPASRQWLKHLDCPVLTFGLHSSAEVMASVVERFAGEQTILLTAGHETAAVQTRMFGDHHVYNCLAAAAVGLGSGLDLPTIARGLEALQQIPGRLEPVVCGQPFGVYVDYGRSPDALAVSLRALRQVTTGRVICLYGADAARDPAERPLLGRVVERNAQLGIIANNNPRHEEPLQIAHDILDGYERPARAHILPDRAEAIRWALGEARTGDAVLISGKGDQQSQVIGGEEQFFDDREVAQEWLRGVGAQIDYDQPPARILSFPRGAELLN